MLRYDESPGGFGFEILGRESMEKDREGVVGRMDEDVLRVLAATPVVPVATASKDGEPNVVPMTFVKPLGDSAVLIADNYMHKAAANLVENPRVAICVWDLETKRAYQIKGRAEVLTAGQVYDEMVPWVQGK